MDQQPEERFLHTLAAYAQGYGDFAIAGATWHGWDYSSRDTLTLHVEDGVLLTMMEVRREAEAFRWRWTLKIAEGVYVRHPGGTVATAEEACAAAAAFRPERLTFDYLGRSTTWFSTSEGHWVAALDGDRAEVSTSRLDGAWRWSRAWPPALPVLELSDGFTRALGGAAPTQEAALIACIDAPERFSRACAALVASLRRAA